MDTTSVQVALRYPVMSDGTELRSLSMRRPKVRDQLAAAHGKGSEEDKEVRLIANLCEVTPEVIEDLDMADYQAIQKAYASFFGPA